MKILGSLPIALALAAGAHAQTVVLDFEDRPMNLTPLPAGYGGVADWGSWASNGGPNPSYPPSSGTHNAYSVGVQSPIRFGQDVVFIGANVVSAPSNQQPRRARSWSSLARTSLANGPDKARAPPLG